jgi:hypothetical protein
MSLGRISELKFAIYQLYHPMMMATVVAITWRSMLDEPLIIYLGNRNSKGRESGEI